MTKTTHAADCRRVFSRYDATCPRCQELAAGASARKGWGDHQRTLDAQRRIDLRNHDCKASRCGVVCTAFDW
jgi:hypothetical protein